MVQHYSKVTCEPCRLAQFAVTQAETTLGVVLFPSGEEEDPGTIEPQGGRTEDSSTAEGMGVYYAVQINVV